MTKKKTLIPATGEFLLYTTADGHVRIETRMQGETVWLNQKQLAELFQTSIPNINMHIKNIFDERELSPDATIQDFLTVQKEGNRDVQRSLTCYNLDMIISVGYRIKSHVATHFRIWATQRLREYIVKGFTMDDQRLKRAGDSYYFEELLARIRDIRSSEKMFWRKVLDIYATSVDYDPAAEASRQFFATIQNKMHWASHGQTAAEVIYHRADAGKPNMGMTSWIGDSPRKADAEVAKNYLNEQELKTLNRIVNFYLEFAELQAVSRKPMYMADWIAKLDEFLKLSDRDILTHLGTVSHEQAVEKANAEYERYRQEALQEPTRAELDFLVAVKELEESYKP